MQIVYVTQRITRVPAKLSDYTPSQLRTMRELGIIDSAITIPQIHTSFSTVSPRGN